MRGVVAAAALVLSGCGNEAVQVQTPAKASCDEFLGTWSNSMYTLDITKSGEKYVLTFSGSGTRDVQVGSCEGGSLKTGSDMGDANILGPSSLIYFGSQFRR